MTHLLQLEISLKFQLLILAWQGEMEKGGNS